MSTKTVIIQKTLIETKCKHCNYNDYNGWGRSQKSIENSARYHVESTGHSVEMSITKYKVVKPAVLPSMVKSPDLFQNSKDKT